VLQKKYFDAAAVAAAAATAGFLFFRQTGIKFDYQNFIIAAKKSAKKISKTIIIF
jgi:hypothetical protein